MKRALNDYDSSKRQKCESEANTWIDQRPPDLPEVFRKHPKHDIEISTLGNIRSNGLIFKCEGRTIRRRELGLTKSGRPKQIQKHCLIAEAFLGPQPAHSFARIKDISLPTTLSNIDWYSEHQLINQDLSAEIWKPCLAPFSNYFYSQSGLLRRDERLVATTISPSGYKYVHIVESSTNKQRSISLHVLIAASEYGPRPKGSHVAHLDDDKLNCSPQNLQYQTISQNLKQAMKRYSRSVRATREDLSFIEFESVNQAIKHFEITYSSAISSWCATGRVVTLKGEKWRFSFTKSSDKQHRQLIFAPIDRLDWKSSTVDWLSAYEFTPDGLVRRIGSNKLVASFLLGAYVYVGLNRKPYQLHIVMLEVFHGSKPSKKCHGDHIDENKTHNCRSNLRWTEKNIEHSCGVPCERFRDNNWERFPSRAAAANQLCREYEETTGKPIEPSKLKNYIRSLTRVLQGRGKTVGGYKWRAVQRGPSEIYTCLDCGRQYERRGPWLSM